MTPMTMTTTTKTTTIAASIEIDLQKRRIKSTKGRFDFTFSKPMLDKWWKLEREESSILNFIKLVTGQHLISWIIHHYSNIQLNNRNDFLLNKFIWKCQWCMVRIYSEKRRSHITSKQIIIKVIILIYMSYRTETAGVLYINSFTAVFDEKLWYYHVESRYNIMPGFPNGSIDIFKHCFYATGTVCPYWMQQLSRCFVMRSVLLIWLRFKKYD